MQNAIAEAGSEQFRNGLQQFELVEFCNHDKHGPIGVPVGEAGASGEGVAKLELGRSRKGR